jgi:hypothetical protein
MMKGLKMFTHLDHSLELTSRLRLYYGGTPLCDNCGDEVGHYCALWYDLPASYLCLYCFAVQYRLSVVELWDTLKKSIGCLTCGYFHDTQAIDGDHRNPATKYRTKSGKAVHPADLFRSCSLRTGVNEIDKLDPLCGTHHKEKSARERREAGTK